MRNTLLALALLSLAPLAQAQSRTDAPPVTRTTGPRLRAGVDVGFGVGFNGLPQQDGPMFALSASMRLGVQVNDWFALYYQGGVLGGTVFHLDFWSETSHPPGSITVHTSSLVAETTLAGLVQIGIGPSFAVGIVGDSIQAGAGLTHRIALTFGGHGRGDRSGFSIGAQGDLDYLPGTGRTIAAVQLTLGGEVF